jgi:hypothetical protein
MLYIDEEPFRVQLAVEVLGLLGTTRVLAPPGTPPAVRALLDAGH